jgi:hypothetical protein
MTTRSDIENTVRSATAILLLPLVALASTAPAFAADTPPPTTPSTTASAAAKPAASTGKPATTNSAAPAAKPAATTSTGKPAATAATAAATDSTAPVATKFGADQLEQMVAPVALYPDPLLTQVFMASTFPVQIVMAARWMEKNPGLKEKALEDALKSQTWDASVKSLCGFPDLLKRLNENLDWAQDMGEAFMAQRSEVLDAVQRMRGKAYESGNLKTTEQQKVEQQPDKIIVIQPSDPEVVYVPQYSATVVYGSAWAYPYYYYPPYYYAPYAWGAVAFTAGVIWGAAMWGGCSWGWGHSDVNIDIDRQNNFNGRVDNSLPNRGDRGQGNRGQASPKAGTRQSWNRNSGAGNKSSKYGGSGGMSNSQARGYDSRSGSGSRGQGGASASTRGAGGAGSSPSTRGGGGAGASASPRDMGGAGGASARGSGAGSSPSPRSSSFGGGSSSFGGGSYGGGSSAWSGSRGGASSTRSSSSRGGMSRGGGGGRGGRR